MYPSIWIYPLMSEAGLIPTKIILKSYQKIYIYQLLTLPNYYLTKYILQIRLKEGDECFQPGEQPKNTLMWVKISKRKLFLLPQQVTCYNAMDFADKVKPVQNFSLNIRDFVNIIIKGKKKVHEKARKSRTGNVFWVSRSKLSQKNARAAIYWKNKKWAC